MNTQSATPGVNDIKSEIMKYYHQLPVTEENSKAVRAAAWALLANVLISDYLNRWNEAETGEKADAAMAVRKALELDDTFALAHYADGLVQRAEEHRNEALEAFERAINWDPTFARAYAQKGSQLINNGQFDDALTQINQAITCGPNDPSAGMFYWNLGRAYFFKEEYAKAIEPLRKAVVLRSNLWHNQLYLASTYANLYNKTSNHSDLDKAKELVKDFLGKHPGFTLQSVLSHEKANPSKCKQVEEGRKRFHGGLLAADMPEK